jgi:hypothetical protein
MRIQAALKRPRMALTISWACWKPTSATTGWANPASITGPMKVRGTAPGKVKWSYVLDSLW